MAHYDDLRQCVLSTFGADIISTEVVGSGIYGSVSKVTIDKPPHIVAVKAVTSRDMLSKESQYINCISQHADIKLPKIYATSLDTSPAFMVMQYFDGVAASNDYVLSADLGTRQNLAKQIADNIIVLQGVTGSKYGELLSPQHDKWLDYYRGFAADVLAKAKVLVTTDGIKQEVLDAMNRAMDNFDMIFDGAISSPTLIHGDYWASNLMVDKEYNLIGVVDPFNALWADSEYELFALNAVYGDKLPVLEAFIESKGVSDNFYVKNSVYLLFSEVYWVTILGHDNNAYLEEIRQGFVQQMSLRFGSTN